MDIGSVSGNTLINQLSGIKPVPPTKVTDDANVTASLESSQNIDKGSVRNVEGGTGSNSGSGVESGNQGKDPGTGNVIDLIA